MNKKNITGTLLVIAKNIEILYFFKLTVEPFYRHLQLL